MLEAGFDQGTSLRNHAPQDTTRMIAMVQHGDAATEQHLLWQLCSVLEDFGHPVAVLDATRCESDANPGLQQCLDAGGWHHRQPMAGAVAVLPAATGLRHLLDTPTADGGTPDVQAQLAATLRIYNVVIVYADAPTVAQLWAQGGGAPLLVATGAQPVVMSAYRSLKQLFQGAGLMPTVASLFGAQLPAAQRQAQSVGDALQRCARDYLGCDVDVLTVSSHTGDDALSNDVQRLALRLLEAAGAPHASEPPLHAAVTTEFLERSR